MNDGHYQLASDVLLGKRIMAKGCFAFDPAVQELMKCGSSALPAIEKLIGLEVARHLAFEQSSAQLHSDYIGLTRLFICYFSLASQRDARYAVEFLNELPQVLQLAAVRSFPYTYKVTPKQASDLLIPPELFAWCRSLQEKLTNDETRRFVDRVCRDLYLRRK